MSLFIRCMGSQNYLLRNYCYRVVRCASQGKSQNSIGNEEDDAPIKYTRSSASKWKAEYSRKGVDGGREPPSYQPLVVSFSVAVFLIYFCILRQESDLDIELGRSLYSRIEGLEESQLLMVRRYNLEHGLDIKDIDTRLHEIENEKNRE